MARKCVRWGKANHFEWACTSASKGVATDVITEKCRNVHDTLQHADNIEVSTDEFFCAMIKSFQFSQNGINNIY